MKLSVFYDHIREAADQTGLPLAHICRLAREAGISGVEVNLTDVEESGEELLSLLDKAGLAVTRLCCYGDFGREPDSPGISRMIAAARDCRCSEILIITGFLREGEDRETHLANMKKGLETLCACASEKGIHVGVEDYDDKIATFSTCQGLKWFLENVPGLHCVFDTGNFLYSEEDVLEAYEELKPWIRQGIHCKDRTWLYHGDEEPKLTVSGRAMYACAVGSGCLPVGEIVTRLLKKGWNGIFTIEHYGTSDQLGCMLESARWLRELESTLSEK